jgi:hypothetical protein
LKFWNSFKGIDNYNFISAQPWSLPCFICDGKHGNYGLYGKWYKNEMEYCLMVLLDAIGVFPNIGNV